MKLLGKTTKGGTRFELGSDTKRVARVTVLQPANVVKLSIYVDGLGSGNGDQVMRGVIYDSGGALVAVGDEVIVHDGQAAGWVDLPLTAYPHGVPLLAASYDFGVIGGAQTNSIRVYGDDPGSGAITGTLPLTVSGNEVTDASRLAAPAVGQMRDGRGVTFVVNLCVNGGFESGSTTPWAVRPNTTSLTADTTKSFSGTKSMKMVTTGANGGATINTGFAAGQTYTLSARVWVPVGVTASVMIQDTSGTTITAGAAGTDAWQYLTVTRTLAAGTTVLGANVFANIATTFWVDEVQVELGSVAHSYVPTSGSIAGLMQGTGDSSFGIRRAATNLHRDGQSASVVIGATWGIAGTGVTIAADPAVPAPFGLLSTRVVCDGTVAQQGVQPTTASGQAAAAGVNGVASVWFRGIAGASYLSWVRWYDSVPANLGDGPQTTFTATGEWQLISPAGLVVPATKVGSTFALMVRINGTRAETFWVAHPMLEKGVPVVAPYVVTSGGTSTSTHSPGSVQAPSVLLDEPQGYIVLRFRSGWASAASPPGSSGPPVFFHWGNGLGQPRITVLMQSNTGVRIQRGDGTTTTTVSKAASWNAGDPVTVVAYWTPTTLGISVNGSAFVTGADVRSIVIPSSTFDLGRGDSAIFGPSESDVDTFWAAGGIGTPVDADATSLNAIGNTDPSWSQLPALPTFLWTANDASYVITQNGRMNVDTYGDGASSTFGASTPVDADMSIFGSYTSTWDSPDRPEVEIARLPWPEAQRVLGSTGGLAATVRPGVCGWYGSAFDDDPGSFAFVAQDGPFQSMVGQRLAISTEGRRAYVYCKAALPLNDGEDLAVTQRVYAALDLLTTVPIEVDVEVLA